MCKCPEEFFGRECDRKIARPKKDQDLFSEQVILSPYSGFFYEENVKEGEKDVTVVLESKLSNANVLFMVNEYPEEYVPGFTRYLPPNVNKSHLSIYLQTLKSSNKEIRAFTVEKDHMCIEFWNFSDVPLTIDVDISRKY